MPLVDESPTRDNRTSVAFWEPPWTTQSPDWQRLNRKLDPDHRARQISRLVDEGSIFSPSFKVTAAGEAIRTARIS
jgi:hypothetical protein